MVRKSRRRGEVVVDHTSANVQKCIPGVPRCERCTELGIEECVYGQKKKRAVGNLLRMGEACLSCRLVFFLFFGTEPAADFLYASFRRRKKVSV